MPWHAREHYPLWFVRAYERLTHADAAQELTRAEWRGRLTSLSFQLTYWQQRRAA